MSTEPSAPTRRPRGRVPGWAALAVVALFVGAAAGGLYLASEPKNGVRVADLEADIRERLPVGSSREEVLAWFNAHGITEVSDLRDTGGGKAGYQASVPNDSYLDKATIQIACRIDRSGKLTDVSIYRSEVRE